MYLVVDRKFVVLMFMSLITNYIKYSETGNKQLCLMHFALMNHSDNDGGNVYLFPILDHF